MSDWLETYLQSQRRGMLLDIGGQAFGAVSTINAGRQYKAQANWQAAQLRQNAGQAVAASQRDAINEDRRMQLVMSRAMAVAAGSDAGAKDPTVLKLLADYAAEGSYRKEAALYQGQERSNEMLDQADATQMQGDVYARSSKIHGASQMARAYGTFMRGSAEASSLRMRYGLKGPAQAGEEDQQDIWG